MTWELLGDWEGGGWRGKKVRWVDDRHAELRWGGERVQAENNSTKGKKWDNHIPEEGKGTYAR